MKRHLPILISMFLLLFVISASLATAAIETIEQITFPEDIGTIEPLPEPTKPEPLPEPIPCTVNDCWLFNNQEQVLADINIMQYSLEYCNWKRSDALTTIQKMYNAASAEIAALPSGVPPDDLSCAPSLLVEPGKSSEPAESWKPIDPKILYKTSFNNLIDAIHSFCNRPKLVVDNFGDLIEDIKKRGACLGNAVTDAHKMTMQADLDAGMTLAQFLLKSDQSSYDLLTNWLNDFKTYFPVAANNSDEICLNDRQNNLLWSDDLKVSITPWFPPALLAEFSASYWSGNLVVKDIGTTGDKLITACPTGTDRTKLTSVVFFEKEGKAIYSIGYSEGKVESLSVFSYYKENDPATDQDESSVIESVQQYKVMADASQTYFEKEERPIYSVGYEEGKVTPISVFMLYEQGNLNSVTEFEASRADINGDGMIDQKDTIALEALLKGYVDINGDGVVDVCSDTDTDAVVDGIDNCPLIPNPDQADSDTDGLGDACDNCPSDPDNDADQDGICGDVDTCPLENPQGLDADSDGCTDTIEGLYEHLQNTEIQAGVKNSLLAKVSSASSSLTRGRMNTTINELGAFINQVEAQAGKKISWEDTAVLVSFAQNIGWTIDPNPSFPDKRPFCPDSPWDKDNPPILTDLYLCQSGCRTDYMNTPDNPAYHRTERFLACMDDCYRRFGPSCEPEPDATPDSQR